MRSPVIFIKNFVSMILVKLSVPIGTSVIFILVARMMGVEAVGRYTLLLTLFLIFQAISSLGMGTLIIRRIAQREGTPECLYASALLIGALSVLFWAPIMIAVAGIGDYPRDILISSIVLAFGLPFALVCQMNEASFMGLGKFEFIPLINFVEVTYLLALSLVVLSAKLGLVALACVLASSKLISACMGIVILAKQISLRSVRISRELTLRLLRMLPPFSLIYGLVILLYRINIVQVSLSVSEKDLGLFSAACKLYFVALILPESFGHALFPYLSSQAPEGNIREISLRSVRYSVLGLTPLVLLFFILGEQLTTMLFGKVYQPSASALFILAWALLPYVANSVFGFALLAGGHEWCCVKIAALAVTTHIMLNYILIRIQGFPGAALSTLLSMVICMLLNMFFLSRLMFKVRIFRDFLYLCLPAVAGGIVSMLVPWKANCARLAAAFLAVAVVAATLKVMGMEDFRWLSERFLLRIREQKTVQSELSI